MSIAVSVAIVPSRRLWRLHVLLYLLVLAAAACAPHAWLRLAMTAAAALAAARGPAFVNLARLDISGVGEMRLAVYPLIARAGCARRATGPPAGPGEAWVPGRAPPGTARAVRLLPGSTLWPDLMLLRLRDDDGAACWLALLPDSVGREAWRQLALALRAVAARVPAPQETG